MEKKEDKYDKKLQLGPGPTQFNCKIKRQDR
jgi:hypothetical protein